MSLCREVWREWGSERPRRSITQRQRRALEAMTQCARDCQHAHAQFCQRLQPLCPSASPHHEVHIHGTIFAPGARRRGLLGRRGGRSIEKDRSDAFACLAATPTTRPSHSPNTAGLQPFPPGCSIHAATHVCTHRPGRPSGGTTDLYPRTGPRDAPRTDDRSLRKSESCGGGGGARGLVGAERTHAPKSDPDQPTQRGGKRYYTNDGGGAAAAGGEEDN